MLAASPEACGCIGRQCPSGASSGLLLPLHASDKWQWPSRQVLSSIQGLRTSPWTPSNCGSIMCCCCMLCTSTMAVDSCAVVPWCFAYSSTQEALVPQLSQHLARQAASGHPVYRNTYSWLTSSKADACSAYRMAAVAELAACSAGMSSWTGQAQVERHARYTPASGQKLLVHRS